MPWRTSARRRASKIDIDDFSIIDDPATYRLYGEGRTVGTFQFESAGMQKYLRELQPSTFEDLIAMNALYRPGPMDYIPDFIARKHGRSPIVYDIPIMEKYLKDTYGSDGLPGAGHAAVASAGQLHPRRVGHAAQGHGQEAQGQARRTETQVHRRRAEERPRPEGARKDLGRLGEVRLLCLQQVARHVLLVGGVTRPPTSRPTTPRSTWPRC